MNKISITHLNNAHNDWLRSLKFYKQEIGILKDRLTDIAGKNTHPDVMKQVEQYENQFVVQADNMQRLTHDIKANIRAVAKEAQISKAGYIDAALLTQHTTLGDRFDMQEKIVNELRQTFKVFAAEWM